MARPLQPHGRFARLVVSASAQRRRAILCSLRPGRVAQLGERGVRNAEVEGSNPFASTIATRLYTRSHKSLHFNRPRLQVLRFHSWKAAIPKAGGEIRQPPADKGIRCPLPRSQPALRLGARGGILRRYPSRSSIQPVKGTVKKVTRDDGGPTFW